MIALRQIPLAQVGATGTTSPGFSVLGTAAGDQTGYSVASAGDFNGDGLNDVLIGSPGLPASTGRVDLINGAALNAGQVSGTITLNAVPSGIDTVTFTGSAAGDLAGWSVGSRADRHHAGPERGQPDPDRRPRVPRRPGGACT